MRTDPDGRHFYTVKDLVEHFQAETVSLGKYGLWVTPKKEVTHGI